MPTKIPNLWAEFGHVRAEVEEARLLLSERKPLSNRHFAALVWSLSEIPAVDYYEASPGKFNIVLDDSAPKGVRRARLDNPAHLCNRKHAWVKELGVKAMASLLELLEDESEKGYCLTALYGEARFDENGKPIDRTPMDIVNERTEKAKQEAARVIGARSTQTLIDSVPAAKAFESPVGRDPKLAEIEAQLAARMSGVDTFFDEEAA